MDVSPMQATPLAVGQHWYEQTGGLCHPIPSPLLSRQMQESTFHKGTHLFPQQACADKPKALAEQSCSFFSFHFIVYMLSFSYRQITIYST